MVESVVSYDVPFFCHAANNFRCRFNHIPDYEECRRGIVLFQRIQNRFGVSVFVAAVKGEVDDFPGSITHVKRVILRQFLDRSVTDGCFSFCLERESPIG